jgi:NitT/TauT family transport system substrate-binding protein
LIRDEGKYELIGMDFMIAPICLGSPRFRQGVALVFGLVVTLWNDSALIAAPTAEPPLQKVSLLLDWYPQAEQGGFFYALINGLYKKEGLDVDFTPINPNVDAEGVVALGHVQFMWSTTNQLMNARSHGLPVVAIMAAMEHDPKGLLIHAESPVHSFADLNGQTMAVAPGSAWFKYILEKYHLVNIREMRLQMNGALFLHDPNYVQECFVTSEPYSFEQAGAKVRTLLVADSGFDPYRAVATSNAFLAGHKDAVKAFVTATIAGWKGYLADPAATDAEIKRRNPEMTQGQIDYSRKTLIDDHFIDGDASKGEAIGEIDPARIAQQCQILKDLHVLPKDFDCTKSYDNEFCAPAASPHP